jgi:hypothetical protein
LPWCQRIALRRQGSPIVAVSLAETIHGSARIDSLVQPVRDFYRELARFG